MKIHLPVHHPRNLQQDRKGMPGRFIIPQAGNIAAIWATLIMVSVSVWVQAVEGLGRNCVVLHFDF